MASGVTDREDFPDRSVEPLDARRKRETEEAAQALRDYRNAQRAVFERMVALRRERLARQTSGRS